MALASVSIDASALARAGRAIGQAGASMQHELDVLVRHRVVEAERDFRAHTPRAVPQPGAPPHPHMADLWQSSIFGPASGAVFNPAEYTRFLYEPTAAHEIEPRPGTAHGLHFFAGGTEVWGAQHVEHPGTQPSAPLVEALGRQIEGAEADLEALGVRTVTDVAAQITLP